MAVRDIDMGAVIAVRKPQGLSAGPSRDPPATDDDLVGGVARREENLFPRAQHPACDLGVTFDRAQLPALLSLTIANPANDRPAVGG